MKRTLKKMMSAAIAAMMLIGCLSIPAFAVDASDNNAYSVNGHQYQLYQIFTGTLNNATLSDLKWGANAKLPDGASIGSAVSSDVIDEIAETSNLDNTGKLDVIKKYVDFTTAAYTKDGAVKLTDNSVGDNVSYTFSNVEPGYYLVKDLDNSQTGKSSAYTTFVVETAGTSFNFSPKSDLPSVDKHIVENDNYVDQNSASIGDIVEYALVATLPSNLGDYNTYYLRFNDTLSKGLTYFTDDTHQMKVEVVNGTDRQDVTQYFGHSENVNGGKTTTILVAIADVIALNNLDGVTVDKDSTIVVTYYAELNTDAVIVDGNPNEVNLTYSNDPNHSGNGKTEGEPDKPGNNPPEPTYPTGETVKETVETFTTGIKIQKVKTDATDGIENLTGAGFTLTGTSVKTVLVNETKFVANDEGDYYKLAGDAELYTATAPTDTEYGDDGAVTVAGNTDSYAKDEDGNYLRFDRVETMEAIETTEDIEATAMVDASGILVFEGLGAGEYTLTETTTPAGYNTMAPITFTITLKDDGTFKIDDWGAAKLIESTGLFEVNIENSPGATLPSTGGIGTTIFYALGAGLVIGAGVILISKKRMDGAED